MKYSFNTGFRFLLLDNDASWEQIQSRKAAAVPVSIPHDWTIGDANRFYEDGLGLYVKKFDYEKSDDKARVFLRFDSVYMDCKVYLNGAQVGEWKYGYTAFLVDLSDAIVEGENELIVTVDYRCPNSRWYSGAGIIRDVWMIEEREIYIPDGEIYVHSEPDGDRFVLTVEVTLSEKWEDAACHFRMAFARKPSLFEAPLWQEMPKVKMLERLEPLTEEICGDGYVFRKTFRIDSPKLWSVKEPNLYKITITLLSDSYQILQEESFFHGFRTMEFTTDKGFFLNGEPMKVNGVCEHHDFGCLGAAFYPQAWERKLTILREMGVNAIRLSHNPAATGVYEACDRLGFLVVPEAFDMWEKPKTEYDYARFFPVWHEKDVRSWVLDARNHASLMMWSIGNEIYDTHAGARGREVAAQLASLTRKFDPMENAPVTLCSNYMPWENTQLVADDLKLIGYNYAEAFYDEHHEKHPDWIIFGSETSSIVYSRGVYHFPLEAGILADDDLQCSALGNSTTSWGARSMEFCTSFDQSKDFSLGQFIWTGFDYIGEPTPYHTKNSYFGQIDTAGFPKDPYFVWKAAWTDPATDPMVHLFPYWDFNPGQLIDLRIASNLPEVELLVNGESLGRKKPQQYLASFRANYTPGSIKAIGYDENGHIVAQEERHSFGDTADYQLTYEAYGDLVFCTVQAIDATGNPVENAADRVTISVTGGDLLGTDNGDSTDFDSYLSDERFLFRGKLLVAIWSYPNREVTVTVQKKTDFIPVRKIELAAKTAENDIMVEARILPPDATCREIDYRLTDKHGNDSPLAKIDRLEDAGDGVIRLKMTPVGDGDSILRVTTNDTRDAVKVISSLEFHSEGLGPVYADAYGFVPGSTYSRFLGEPLGNGNERGVATAREGMSCIIFDGVDFGPVGTEEMTIPIFTLNDEHYELEIWKGVPGEEGAALLNNDGYQKVMIWNVYQPETYRLSERVSGVQTITLKVNKKFHIKGFSCTPINPIYEPMWAGSAKQTYGDTFTRNEKVTEHIGNNVTVCFGSFDFEKGVSKITVFGRVHNGSNTLHVRFLSAQVEEIRTAIEFKETQDGEYEAQTFEINRIFGSGELELVFLPGCDFDLGWIKFTDTDS